MSRTSRKEKALALAGSGKIRRVGDYYEVPASRPRVAPYIVTALSCTCPDWEHRAGQPGFACAHMQAAQIVADLPRQAEKDAV